MDQATRSKTYLRLFPCPLLLLLHVVLLRVCTWINTGVLKMVLLETLRI